MPVAASLICGSLGCLLEASLHSESFFESFKNAGRFQALLQKALLQDQRQPIRLGTARAISSICDHPTYGSDLPQISNLLILFISLESSKKHDFASYCWESLVTIIPETLQHGRYAEEFYGVATIILRNLDDPYRQNLDLTAYVQAWTNLLLEHHHDEVCWLFSLEFVLVSSIDRSVVCWPR